MCLVSTQKIMQEAANKKKCLFGDPKDHNSGNTDSGNPERVF